MARARTASPAPAGPPPITVDDLDRDELAELVRRAFVLQRPRDLWGARWTVASERARQAFERESAASDAAAAALHVVMAGMGAATKVQRTRWEAARAEHDRARKARQRADRREDQAWTALDACP